MFNEVMFSSANGNWETPQELFDELNSEFHFTLDACASSENAKVSNFYSENSLQRIWKGRVWCNPPYGMGIWQWIRKGYESALNGDAEIVVMLLPARTDTPWFHNYCIHAQPIRFIVGRLKFSGHSNSAPFPSMIVVFEHSKLA